MEESDPDPPLAGQSSSATTGDRVAGEEEEAECSGMEIAFAAWKRTGPPCNAQALSKFPSESKNVKVYMKRKAHSIAELNIFEAPLKKQKNVEILARAKDVEVGPLNLPSSMPLAIVVADISQAMGTDDKTENASRNNQMENTFSNPMSSSLCTTLPHPQLEERKSEIGKSPMEPTTLSASQMDRQRSGVEPMSSSVNGEEQVSTADLIQPEFRNVNVTPETSQVEVAALIVTNDQVAASMGPSDVKPVTAEGDQCEDASASTECLQSETTNLPVLLDSCANVHGDSLEAGLIQLELENGTDCAQANKSEVPALVVTDDQVAAASNGASRIELITAECDQCPTTSVRIEEAVTSVECLLQEASKPPVLVGACENMMNGGSEKVDFVQSESENVTVSPPEASKAVAATVTRTDDDQAVDTNGHSGVEWVTVEVNQWPPNCTLVIDQASALLKCLRSAAKGQSWIGSSGNAHGALQEAGLIQSKSETIKPHYPESSKAVAAACNVPNDQVTPLNGPSKIVSVTAEVDQCATSSLGNQEVSAPVECMQWDAKQLPEMVNSCENVHGESQESSLIQLESENANVLLKASQPVAAAFIVTDCHVVAASNGHSKIELGTNQVDQSAISTTAGIKETIASSVECMQCEAELPVPANTYENVQGKPKEAGQIQSDLEHAKFLLEASKLVAAADVIVTDHQAAAAASNGPSEIVLGTGEVDQCATSCLQTKHTPASVECVQSEAKLQAPMGLCVSVPHDSQEGLKSIVTNPEILGGVNNPGIVSPVKPDSLSAPKAKRTPLTFPPLEACMVVGNHSAASGVLNTNLASPAAPVMSNVNSTVLLAKRSPLPPAAPVTSNVNSMVLLAKRSPLPIPVLRPPSLNPENFQVPSLENLSKQQKSSGMSSPKKPKIADINHPEENSDPDKDGEDSRSAVSEENVHLGNPRISGIRSARKGKLGRKEAQTGSPSFMTNTPVQHLNRTRYVQSEVLETVRRSNGHLPDLHPDHEGVSSVRRPRSARKSYLCSKCMVLKKGHKCPLGGTGSKDGEGSFERQDSAVKASGPPAADPRPPQSTRLKLRLRVKPPMKKC
ncbi:unnamed protein product [Sphagnum jensenii]|uniref:Uncharacterized protein n=1 Tax=Sphagnum jensenii TaxID=128206 RepID=A0ABP1BEL8_9BRYO